MVEYSIKYRKTRWWLSRTVDSIVGATHGMRKIKLKLWDVTFPQFWCRELWSFRMLCGAAGLTDTDISNESTASIHKDWGALELFTVLPPGNVFPLSSVCQAGWTPESVRLFWGRGKSAASNEKGTGYAIPAVSGKQFSNQTRNMYI
jgi:hypothetical protein